LHNILSNMPMRRCGSFFLPVLLALPLCTLAADGERQLPVNLRADHIDFDQKKGLSVYRGHVVFSQGSLRLTATRAEVQSRASVVETVTAEGKPVSFRHLPEGQVEFINGEARRAVYHAPTRRVDLYDEVQIHRGRDLFRSGVLHYDIENQSIIAESANGQRVYTALVPHAGTAPLPGERP